MNPTLPPAKGRKVSNTLLVWWLGSITNWMDMSLSKLQYRVEDRGAWSARVHGVRKSQTRLGYLLNSNSLRQLQVQIKRTNDKDTRQDSGVPYLLYSFGLLFGCLLGLDINPNQMSLTRHNLQSFLSLTCYCLRFSVAHLPGKGHPCRSIADGPLLLCLHPPGPYLILASQSGTRQPISFTHNYFRHQDPVYPMAIYHTSLICLLHFVGRI